MSERRRVWLAVSVFAAWTLLVTLRRLAPLDLYVTTLVQRYGQQWLDEALFGLTLLGSVESTGLLVAATGVWLWARGRRRAAWVLWASLAALTLIELTLKFTVPQPHVPNTFHRSPASGILWLHLRTPYAFPSGHTLRSVFILGYIAALIGQGGPRRRVLRALLWTVIALICISRIYLGDHWASDVIGGLLLAIAGLWWLQRNQINTSAS